MLLENSFDVPAKLDDVWVYLTDVEKVVPCMPGASLTETIDEENFKGKVNIKLGPVSMSLAGKISIAERSDDEHRIVLDGSGMEQRGKGRVAAKITTTAEEIPTGTKVNVVQDLKVQGQMASMSRGMMQDVSAKLTKQFADCLQKNLEAEPEAATPATEGAAGAEGGQGAGEATGERAAPTRPPAKGPAATGGEVKGFTLAASALWAAIKRFFSRLFKRKGSGRAT